MEYLDIAALFVTTFLGAFLAFGLENLRERRRLTTWVRQHVVHLRGIMLEEVSNIGKVDKLLAQQVAACDAWLAAAEPADVSEEQWDLVGGVITARAPDFGAVLRSEAVTAIPAQLALAMVQTELFAVGLEQSSNHVQATLTMVLPLWFDRTAPLSESDRRRVLRQREALTSLIDAVNGSRAPLAAMVDAINEWLD